MMADTRKPLTVCTYGFNVPCRRFLITANISRDKRLPVVDEFFLRALKLCERVPVRRLGRYFGFSEAETEIVTADLVARGLIDVQGDTAALHPSAQELFRVGEDGLPRIMEIETWVEHVWFDLVSRNIMPADRTRTSKNLADIKPDEVAREMPASFAKSAFEQNFAEYLRNVRRISDPGSIGLYSISGVESGRFGFVVVKGREDPLLDPQPKLEPHLLEVEIGSIARFRPLSDAILDRYRGFSGPEPSAAALSDYVRLTGDETVTRGHSDGGYFDIASWIDRQGAAGNPDRQPIVGATYIERNIEFFVRMLEAKGLSHQERDKPRNLELVWWRPAGTSWGASPDLDASISSIKGSVRHASRSWRVRSTLVVTQASRHENNKRFERIFDQACIAPAGYLSPAVEVVLLKGAGAIVTVCVRLSAVTFVPVGFVIVDIPTINALEKVLRLNDGHEFHQLWRHAIREDEEVAVAEEAVV
jgi:hypothetical protein